jgi:hypothetical protein
MTAKNIELIKQALGAAESSIKLAKQLLSEIEGGSAVEGKPKQSGIDLPGISGIFDGEQMVSEDGVAYPVPANYASKSMLVVGDTLKLVEEGKNKDKRFKQIEHVKRHKSTGILTKKDGKWKVVTAEGSYKVLPAAVEHFGAEIGTEVTLHLPANNLTVAYGAIESVSRKEKGEVPKVGEKVEPASVEVKHEAPKVEDKVEEKPKAEEKAKEAKTIEPPKKPEPVAKPKPVVKKEPEPKKEEPKPAAAAKPVKAPQVAVPDPAPIPAPPSAPKVPVTPAVAPMEVPPEEDELT